LGRPALAAPAAALHGCQSTTALAVDVFTAAPAASTSPAACPPPSDVNSPRAAAREPSAYSSCTLPATLVSTV
jgi:hypothetical protein